MKALTLFFVGVTLISCQSTTPEVTSDTSASQNPAWNSREQGPGRSTDSDKRLKWLEDQVLQDYKMNRIVERAAPDGKEPASSEMQADIKLIDAVESALLKLALYDSNSDLKRVVALGDSVIKASERAPHAWQYTQPARGYVLIRLAQEASNGNKSVAPALKRYLESAVAARDQDPYVLAQAYVALRSIKQSANLSQFDREYLQRISREGLERVKVGAEVTQATAGSPGQLIDVLTRERYAYALKVWQSN